MNIWAMLVLSTVGMVVAVIALIAFLGMIALRRCEGKDVPAVLEALGTLAGALARAAALFCSRLSVARGMAAPGIDHPGHGRRTGEEASDGTTPGEHLVEH